MKLAYPAFAVAKANAKGKCCERRRRSRAQCLSACTGVVDFFRGLHSKESIAADIENVPDDGSGPFRIYGQGSFYKTEFCHL